MTRVTVLMTLTMHPHDARQRIRMAPWRSAGRLKPAATLPANYRIHLGLILLHAGRATGQCCSSMWTSSTGALDSRLDPDACCWTWHQHIAITSLRHPEGLITADSSPWDRALLIRVS